MLSITANSLEQNRTAAQDLQITIPHLSDADLKVSNAYGVMRWATPAGTPSHTFVLVDKSGRVVWLQDYGAKQNGGRMYVPLDELYARVSEHLPAGRQ